MILVILFWKILLSNGQQSCGDIDYCVVFTPDGCNSCGCSTNNIAMCTEMYCGPPTTNKCTSCMDGYDVKDGKCIPHTCNLPQKVGPCRAALPRYWYNNETQTCDVFLYGGCQPNDNNFEDLASCQRLAAQCGADSTTTKEPTCAPVKQCNSYSTQCSCTECNNGYSLVNGQCVTDNGGCGGFEHCVSYFDGCNSCSCGANGLTACTMRYCFQYQEPECKSCEDGYVLIDGQCKESGTSNDVCSLPKESGMCRAAFRRYYYDTASKECLLFTYGGCGGNGNNFKTYAGCCDACAAGCNSALTMDHDTAAAFSVTFSVISITVILFLV